MSVGWVFGASREFKDSIGNTLTIESRDSAKLAFVTLKTVGKPPKRARMPVNVKKSPLTSVTLGGTMKSLRMSGSPAIALWMMANEEISSAKNFMLKVFEAMEENLRFSEGKS